MIRLTPESVARGLRELADSVESWETLVDDVSVSEEVNGVEFTRTTLTFTYVAGDFRRSKPTPSGKLPDLSKWWDECGQCRFKRR